MSMILKSSVSSIFSKRQLILNARLISNQDLKQEEVDKIYKLHRVRNCYITLMEISSSKEDLRYLSRIIVQIDFQLQSLWKFKEDRNFHRFWELPHCSCEVNYINTQCLVHGDF